MKLIPVSKEKREHFTGQRPGNGRRQTSKTKTKTKANKKQRITKKGLKVVKLMPFSASSRVTTSPAMSFKLFLLLYVFTAKMYRV